MILYLELLMNLNADIVVYTINQKDDNIFIETLYELKAVAIAVWPIVIPFIPWIITKIIDMINPESLQDKPFQPPVE